MMKISRNINGEILADGELICKIPQKESMLSIFGVNQIDKGEYRSDGWIHVKNKKYKKWFKEIEGLKIWFPKLKNLSLIEDIYYKLNQKSKRYYQNVYKEIENKLMEAKVAYYKDTTGRWLRYSTKKAYKYEYIDLNWFDVPIVGESLNLEIGIDYYKKNNRLLKMNGIKFKIAKVLNYAITEYLRINYPPKGEEDLDRILEININKRLYIYKCIKNANNYYWWEKYHWPMDKEVIKVKI